MLSAMSSMPPSLPSSPAPAPMTSALPIIPRASAAGQRPKLSLSTANTARSFGKGASLRLDTLSAVSPTRLNTFSNAYPALERPAKPRLCIDSSVPHVPGAASTNTPSSASTLSSATTSASHDSATISIPYKQPHNLVSVLVNSPARARIPRKMAASRPMFPAAKRVAFRTPLEEEITTVKYTLAHSDLEASVSTLASMASSASATTNHASPESSPRAPSLQPDSQPKQPRAGDKRDSSSSEEDSDSCPETPVAGRRKRTRDWRWTLAPVSALSGSDKSTHSDATTSEDSC
ncbi:hypothetical protein ACEQ8H_003907 [Pleosporales sp. CAS-2024a]